MIDELSYDEVLKISNELKKQIGIVSNISTSNQEIKDFISTVEGYSKYLEFDNKYAGKSFLGNQ